jgi:hypothetical protein
MTFKELIMRRAWLTTIGVALAGVLACGDETGPGDSLWLSLEATTIDLPNGEEEVLPAVELNVTGLGRDGLQLPLCPNTIHGGWPVYAMERKVGTEWELVHISTQGECDYANVEATQPLWMASGEPDLRLWPPYEAGTYRYWLYVETAAGERKAIYSPELTAVE